MARQEHVKEASTFVFTDLGDEGFVLAGQLTMSQEPRFPFARFTYAGSYLRRSKAYSLDPLSLPLRPGPQETADAFPVFSGIRDAAPDGWGRHLLNRAAGVLELSEFDYLIRSGDDRVGSLGFGPTPDGPQRLAHQGEMVVGERFSVEELQEIVIKGLSEEAYSPSLKRMFYRGSSGLGGARPKGTAWYRDRLWLAKFSRKDDSYNQPAIEFANMTLASKAGIAVPETLLISLPGGMSVYLIERFDRSLFGKKSIKRHPFISALTAVGAHESDFNRWGYSDLAAFIFKEVPQAENDLEQLFRRIIFNILTGNTDDHLRNHGFLLDETTGIWRLSPAYDIVPQAGIHSAEKFGFLKLTSGRQATIENAWGLASDCRLTTKEAQEITHEILVVVRDWRTHYRSHGVSSREIEALEKSFSETTRFASTLSAP